MRQLVYAMATNSGGGLPDQRQAARNKLVDFGVGPWSLWRLRALAYWLRMWR